ncbi:hypothetical protein VTN49DRAFT_2554 [Thermomyces lanuginosus]|uniref:uncharacterized protein n=1 Tax=Thermomyces lanuginosus TaxID=5541 RepID=UPI00374288AC
MRSKGHRKDERFDIEAVGLQFSRATTSASVQELLKHEFISSASPSWILRRHFLQVLPYAGNLEPCKEA